MNTATASRDAAKANGKAKTAAPATANAKAKTAAPATANGTATSAKAPAKTAKAGKAPASSGSATGAARKAPAKTTPAKAAPATAPASNAAPATAEPCRDFRCDAGVTACRGCRGHGVLKANGGHYRYRTPQANISPNATTHDACKGSGKRRCGCQRVDAARSKAIGKQQTADELAV